MAIDLPPLPPPELSDIQTLKPLTSNAGIELTAAGYPVRIAGVTLLDPDEVKTALSPAKDLSQLVRALNALYRLNGYIAVRLLYVLDGKTLLVHVSEGCIREIDTPPRLQDYLDDLIGDCALTAARYTQAKQLPDLLTDRAGQNVTTEARFEGTGKDVTLYLESTPDEDYDRTEWSLTFGNPGNRFLGRYFAGAGVRHHTHRGTELTAAYTRALTSLGRNPSGGKGLDALQLGAGFVHPWGLFSASGSYVEYEQELAGFDLEAEIGQFELAGQQLLPSRPTARWVVSEKLLYVDSQIEEPTSGLDLQDETYPAIELGTVYSEAFNLFNLPLSGQAGIALRHGLGDQDGSFPISGRRADFLLARPNGSLTWNMQDKRSLALSLNGQFTSDSLPQQQQWVLGGHTTMSAWLPGVLIGDSGIHLKLEYQHTPWQLRERPLKLSAFAELGEAEFEDLPSPLDERRRLSDAGLRLNYEICDGLTLEGVAAVPISDDGLAQDFLDDLRSDAFFSLRQVW